MSKERIVRYKKGMKDDTDWARIAAMTDDDIDYSDCPPLGEDFWKNAKLIMPEPKASVSVGVCFDRAIINWFKKQGPGYQSRMNAVLKTYVEAQKALVARKKKPRKAA